MTNCSPLGLGRHCDWPLLGVEASLLNVAVS